MTLRSQNESLSETCTQNAVVTKKKKNTLEGVLNWLLKNSESPL